MYGYVNVYSDILMVYMVVLYIYISMVVWYGSTIYIIPWCTWPCLALAWILDLESGIRVWNTSIYGMELITSVQYSTVHGGILIDRLYKTIRRDRQKL